MNQLLPIIFVLAATLSARGQSITAAPIVPDNLGLGLKQLVELHQQDARQAIDSIHSSTWLTSDESGRVVVNIYLNGDVPFGAINARLADLGLSVLASDPHWRGGVISAALPLGQGVAVAQLSGVQSVVLAHRPIRHVGAVTAQSSVVEHAEEVNTPGVVTAAGILGRGISVGIVSDSFDGAAGVPRASVGVAAGDLPGPGNPDGYSEPVAVLADDSRSTVVDEGRAMAEIVHDIAPAAKIAFSSAGSSQVAMANSIRNLRSDGRALCDIIVDDISFPDEPFFSDGIITKAVEDVATSNSLGGKKVTYFSASGNNTGGYSSDANIISVASGQARRGNLVLSQVPAQLYAGGFHNFGTSSDPVIGITVKTGADKSHTIAFQWDDPFNTGNVTTDYNLLVFDATGRYLSAISGIDNNQATSHPVEIVDLAANTTYQLVISLRTTGAPTARHFRLINADGNDVTGTYISSDTITLYGHAATLHANSVAAYVYNNNPNIVGSYNADKSNPPPGPFEPAVESFNARGGSLPFYFNAQGQRLPTPELRMKPDFAAVDGVDTSFFPKGADVDYDKDGYPNFFGTSAAAPNAAAFAALMLEAAGGPGSLSSAQVNTMLQQSASAHDLDANFSRATATNGGVAIIVTAAGDDSNQSATSPTFFTAAFSGQTGESLDTLVIDLTNSNLVFDPSTDQGFPFTVGQNASNIPVTATLSSDLRTLTLSFGSGFNPGASISFGIDRDLIGIHAGGNSADLLGGALIVGTTHAGQTLYGAFANRLGNDFSPTEGYGLLDARRAVETIVGKNASGKGIPLNLSTRGQVGSADDVLIGGIIVSGSAPKRLILRAMGPSIPVAGALADPFLELYDSNGLKLATNDNWEDDPSQAAQIRATGIAPSDRRESALVQTLAPAAYTAVVRGAQASGGIALVEAYDLDAQPAASYLANIATRGSVQAGDNALIGGFILNAPSRVVVRAIGPSLAASGVAGYLSDPALELRDAQGSVVMSNDNWQQNAFQAMQLQTIGIAPADPLESAMTLSLNAGAYTPIVRGAHGTTGVGLVEVYDLQ
ncbi:MAG: S8 family serine peptidase [Verrucomicrobiota bacterium]|nr:S8 family serine peptidase [Verrucomicrobiota bacterium]